MSRHVHCKTCDRPMKNIIVNEYDTLLIWDGHQEGTRVAQCVRGDCEDIGNVVPIHQYKQVAAVKMKGS